MTKTWNETLYDAWGQRHDIDKVYFEFDTGHQQLMIFHNALFGRVMVLDGVVQTTEKDEFIYHEMLTHVPILAHGKAEKVVVFHKKRRKGYRKKNGHRQYLTKVKINGIVG